MPFTSNAQRRYMYARHPEIAERWEMHTPPGKLPEKATKIKQAYAEGVDAALEVFGFKEAAEEIRLKIPKREFHGFAAAFKAKTKKADSTPLEPQADPNQPAEALAALFQQLPVPKTPSNTRWKLDELNRPVTWSNAMDVSKGAV